MRHAGSVAAAAGGSGVAATAPVGMAGSTMLVHYKKGRTPATINTGKTKGKVTTVGQNHDKQLSGPLHAALTKIVNLIAVRGGADVRHGTLVIGDQPPWVQPLACAVLQIFARTANHSSPDRIS